jgi:hypothetical protein
VNAAVRLERINEIKEIKSGAQNIARNEKIVKHVRGVCQRQRISDILQRAVRGLTAAR